jgi:cardiolipin synthase (CMP-forming)
MIYYRIANTLTVLRLTATPFIILLLKESHDQYAYYNYALVALIAMQASDVLDGFIARLGRKKTHIINRFGIILDPIADKAYINSTYITLYFIYGFPLWLTIIVLSKDLLIAFGWVLRIKVTRDNTISPSITGKIADTFQAFLIFAFMLEVPSRMFLVGALSTAFFTLVSGIGYMRVGIRSFLHQDNS